VKREYLLMLANIDGTNERVLSKRGDRDTFSTYGLSWSPDGNTIVCPAGRWTTGFHLDLMAIDVNSGNETAIGNQSWSSVYQVAWRDDGSVIFSAREKTMSPHRLWRISYPGGVAERITNDLSEYRGVSLSGDKIVTVQTDWTWQTWIATLDSSAGQTPIASGQGLTYGISWTAKGKIVFSAMTQDRLDLLRVHPDGSNRVPLTVNAGDNYNPSASADGQFIVFTSTRNGTFDIYRFNADDGSDVTQLTSMDRNAYPSISSDNQWVAYDHNADGTRSVWKVPFEGGQPVKVAERYRMPVFSPNNQLIAARYEPRSGTRDVIVFPADGGAPLAHVPVPEMEWQRVYWLDDHTLSFIKNDRGTSNIWSYDLHTKASKQLTNFSGDQIFAYAWSPDHKQVAAQRGAKLTNVIMISSER
jgi:TolB protein